MVMFPEVLDGLATLLNTSSANAGFLAGGILVFVIYISLSWLLKDHLEGPVVVLPFAFPVTLVVIFEWWPIWTIIFIGLFVAFVIVNPFKGGM